MKLFSHVALSIVVMAAILIFSESARAGFIELGVSGSYKKSVIGTNAYDESQSLTGSVSYYFDESSAVEFSYTDGVSRRRVGEGQPNGQLTNMYYKTIGLDLILTLGEREATLRPYIKVGGVYIMEKKLVTQSWLNGNIYGVGGTEDPPALVPSAGVGFKLALTKNWSLKLGIDAWSSRALSETPVTIDYAARVGLACIF